MGLAAAGATETWEIYWFVRRQEPSASCRSLFKNGAGGARSSSLGTDLKVVRGLKFCGGCSLFEEGRSLCDFFDTKKYQAHVRTWFDAGVRLVDIDARFTEPRSSPRELPRLVWQRCLSNLALCVGVAFAIERRLCRGQLVHNDAAQRSFPPTRTSEGRGCSLRDRQALGRIYPGCPADLPSEW